MEEVKQKELSCISRADQAEKEGDKHTSYAERANANNLAVMHEILNDKYLHAGEAQNETWDLLDSDSDSEPGPDVIRRAAQLNIDEIQHINDRLEHLESLHQRNIH
jgi:hypothetical protein